jgi:hypothetical protein
VPVVLLRDGVPLGDAWRASASTPRTSSPRSRRSHGLERLSQIGYAVLERNGSISIVPETGTGG